MLKYYIVKENGITEVQIESGDYTELVCLDARIEGETMTAAKRVIRENRQEARETGENRWTAYDGTILIIRK